MSADHSERVASFTLGRISVCQRAQAGFLSCYVNWLQTGQTHVDILGDGAAAWRTAADADRIIPPDETRGAAEAGAAELIRRLLKEEMSGERATYLEGLDGIDREVEARPGRAFAAPAPSDQDDMLRAARGEGL